MKLLVLQGLPASGKTTYAKQLVDNKWYKRINKDDLRAMIDNSKWNKENEDFIIHIQTLMIGMFLSNKYNVVIDDTNFNQKHIKRFKELAKQFYADFELKFFDTPLYECIDRDDLRIKNVGKKVILDMYNKYLYKPKEFKIDESKEQCVIIDVDGTLAYRCDREIFDYNKVKDDVANEKLIKIINSIKAKKIIVSGRNDDSKAMTEEWLKSNGVEYDEIYMRITGDNRDDTIVKKEIYENNIKDRFDVLSVFDDRPKVIRMWKELGLFVNDCNTEDPRIDF